MASAAAELTAVVTAWLESLDEAQLLRATFPFDAAERFVWAYTPGTREGLAIRDLRREQRAAAAGIVAAAASARAAREVAAIMALETVLGQVEAAAGRSSWTRRDPELYWHAVFGEPGGGSPWSWRIGGHHVAIHITVDGDRIVASTPSFLGANPAVVPTGPGAGTRTLPGEELLGRELLGALTPAERAAAVIDDVAPADILTGTARRADASSVPTGIRHAGLRDAGRAALERLIRHYLDRASPEAAGASWTRIEAGGIGDVTFAWAGSDAPGRGHYYAIVGPTFLIEYDSTQNGANHIHAVWRDLENDWGGDLLGKHLAEGHADERP